MLHYDTVTDTMKSLAQIILDNFDAEYYLAGGTALALHVGHRESIDLDYFSPELIDTEALKHRIFDVFVSHTVEITYEDKNTLWCIIDDVKVSFITRKEMLIRPLVMHGMFRLASIEDITVMKLSAICGRDEYKDYFDLACISNITDVRSWPSWWQEVYSHVDMTSWLVALGSAETILPLELDVHSEFIPINVVSKLNAVTKEITDFIR